MSIYPKLPYIIGRATSVLQVNRVADKLVTLTPALPGSVIVIHGVNDVGVSYNEVEQGICEGLNARLAWGKLFRGARYRVPEKADLDRLEPDPDAVFFKRQWQEGDHTPVIPFYWGYREAIGRYKTAAETTHGQAEDRYGNRLDKDYSKGGGPFANATTTLPDMWGRGKWGALGLLNRANGDPLRPVLDNPGRLYMVLAARRLAALISMIREYEANDSVSIVAHSQGCLISLLAQAFLAQSGLRPADTLVLTHPPYSLVDDLPAAVDAMERPGHEDALMHGRYGALQGGQTLHARLSTLANIVEAVATRRHAVPALAQMKDPSAFGVVGTDWQPGNDRDNRGKVYLYFCPEDMTVSLQHVQGIGWQGVPEAQAGSQLHDSPEMVGARRGYAGQPTGRTVTIAAVTEHQPFRELTRFNTASAGFFQRVFTAKKRPDPQKGQPVLVGQAAPYDFELQVTGESGFEHAADMRWYNAARIARSGLATNTGRGAARDRAGIRVINGDVLKSPVAADMYAGSVTLPGQPRGGHEAVDPIDAAIASTSPSGDEYNRWEVVDDPTDDTLGARLGQVFATEGDLTDSPRPQLFKGKVRESRQKVSAATERLNRGKPNNAHTRVVKAYTCHQGVFSPLPNGRLLVERTETPDEIRLRQQHATAARSFHGAIFGSAKNHQHVTAYDIAIGQGAAVSRPEFRDYLCAVADWRLKKLIPKEKGRPGILTWDEFIKTFDEYYKVEPEWRKQLIEGNSDYYSTGVLPSCLPLLPEGLPPAVVCETMTGQRIAPPTPAQPKKTAAAKPETMGEWLARNPLPDDYAGGGKA